MAAYEGGMEGNVDTSAGTDPQDNIVPADSSQMEGGLARRAGRSEEMTESGRIITQAQERPSAVNAPSNVEIVDIQYCRPSTDYAPPVTADALRELELPRILGNPKLRHDVVFDLHLHFRPNTEGERGRKKRREANAYWNSLRHELVKCVGISGERHTEVECELPRLRRLLCELRDILRTLVPECDIQVIEDTFDVSLRMQQIRHFSFDYTDLVGWLSSLIKAHCAPIRDPWVDDMVGKFAAAANSDDVTPLLDGIRMLFGILEAMKLDVANHQVRNLRTLLIEDTITFERRQCLKHIERGRLDISSAQTWYNRNVRLPGSSTDSNQAAHDGVPVAPLVNGLVDFLLLPTETRLPSTFALDDERLQALRLDLQGHLALEVCNRVFQISACIDLDLSQLPSDNIRERLEVIALSSHDEVDGLKTFRLNTDQLAVEMARLVRIVKGEPAVPQVEVVDRIEARLERSLRLDSSLWRIHKEFARKVIDREALKQTQTFLSQPVLTAAESVDALCQRDSSVTFEARLVGVATKLAHIASLHWHVFGSLVYLHVPEHGRNASETRRNGAEDDASSEGTASD